MTPYSASNCSLTAAGLSAVVRNVSPTARLLRAWRLAGGVSAEVSAVEAQMADGSLRRMVVRCHGPGDLRRNPRIASDEHRLLEALIDTPARAPRPLLADVAGTALGGRPYLVVEYLEGSPDGAPSNRTDGARQLGACLAAIHGVDPTNLTWLETIEQRVAGLLDSSEGRGHRATPAAERRFDALKQAWPSPSGNAPALLHGDFWPGNVLWQGGTVSGVVDWEDAALGDPLADLANARLEVLWAWGQDAMVAFTASYLANSAARPLDTARLPWWDLWAATRAALKMPSWGLAPATARTMTETLDTFAAWALDRLD